MGDKIDDYQQRPPPQQLPESPGPSSVDGAQQVPATPPRELIVPRMWMSALALKERLTSRQLVSQRRVVAAVLVLGVLAFLFGLRSPSPSTPAQTSPDTRVYMISGRPTLNFEHFIGNVNIVAGPNGQVSITEMRNGATGEIETHYAQQGDTVTISADIPGGLMEDTWVDFTVRVPSQAGLSTTLSTGTLEATGLRGNIALANTNGAIWATNLAGRISLRTQSGSINLTNVSGPVTIITQNGTVTTSATHLEGGSSIRAESGTINFHGSLSSTGAYQFENSNGAVGITLPANSAFALMARTNGGSINSDFHGVTVTQQGGHSQAQGMVGHSVHARLVIQTAGGSIDLHPGN